MVRNQEIPCSLPAIFLINSDTVTGVVHTRGNGELFLIPILLITEERVLLELPNFILSLSLVMAIQMGSHFQSPDGVCGY
jgi:hypothetical protein